MPTRLSRASTDFDAQFRQFLAAKREVSADVEAAARAIVDDVARRGDAALLEATRKFDRLGPGGAALLEATRKFDRLELDAASLRVMPGEVEAAVEACDAATLDALKFARDRIE